MVLRPHVHEPRGVDASAAVFDRCGGVFVNIVVCTQIFSSESSKI